MATFPQGAEIHYNLAILTGQRAYPGPKGERVQSHQITSVAVEFLEIFATDIQRLQERAVTGGERREVVQLQSALSHTAGRLFDIIECGHLAFQQEAVPLLGRPQSPAAFARPFEKGRIKTGIEKLEGNYMIRRAKGDGHCLFRCMAFGLALHYQRAAERQPILENLEALKKVYPAIAGDLQQVIAILQKQVSAEDTLTTRDVSNQLVAALRKLACAYNRGAGSDVFASLATVDSGSVESYLTQMSSFERAKYGTEAEVRALSTTLGIKIEVVDAAVQNADPKVPLHKTVIHPSRATSPALGNVGVTFLFRANHYDFLA